MNESLPNTIMLNGRRYVADPNDATRVSIHGMYDCHMFTAYTGSTVDSIIEQWKAEVSAPDKRYGPPCLCPVTVLHEKRELRRVGEMVHTVYGVGNKPSTWDPVQLSAWREAVLADPDISRLLAAAK